MPAGFEPQIDVPSSTGADGSGVTISAAAAESAGLHTGGVSITLSGRGFRTVPQAGVAKSPLLCGFGLRGALPNPPPNTTSAATLDEMGTFEGVAAGRLLRALLDNLIRRCAPPTACCPRPASRRAISHNLPTPLPAGGRVVGRMLGR